MLFFCILVEIVTATANQDLTNWIQPNTGSLASEGSASCKGLEVHVSNRSFSSNRKGETGGHWSPCTHLKTYGMNSAPGTARFLANILKPKTSLEFGCGLGLLSDYIRRFANTDATCIEPDKALDELLMKTASLTDGGLMTAIRTNLLDDENQHARSCASSLMEKKFDLVLSIEVAEHIPAKYHKNFVKLLAASTGKWLVFSGARLGQAGTGHLDESSFPKERWVSIFEEAGLEHMPLMSMAARDSGYWGRSYDIYGNTIVMKNPSYAAKDSSDVSGMNGFKWIPATTGFNAGAGDPKLEIFEQFRKDDESSLWPDLVAQIRDIKDGKRKCDDKGTDL